MKKYSILVVDDEENLSRLLSKFLIKEGYSTYSALNGNEALEIIDKHEIDIVITDIKMPGISGIELFSVIRNIDPSIKVILITAFATVETAIEALRMGARDYITKPFNLDEVLNSVKNIVSELESTEDENYSDDKSLEDVECSLTVKSPAMKKVMRIISQVSDSRATVMIHGETGTGKEMVANTIHGMSSRKEKPFIKVNCAAIPETLLESELFGFEKGAFTGAINSKPGRFELADGGSIFLDEIGDIPHAVQVKLLRVLQEREFERLGGIKTIKVDVRVISATNKNLEELVKTGQFREDLFYRLNVIPIELPPLRDRKEDIRILIDTFLLKSSDISGRPKKRISEEAVEKLIAYSWPGNIRELENIIERCVVISSEDVITAEDIPDYIKEFNKCGNASFETSTLDNAIDNTEKDIIIETLRECGGNRTKAAELLGISRRSLHRKIAKYNIED